MSSLAVVTTAFTNNEDEWYYLRESSRRHDLPLHVLGVGQNYPGLAGLPDFMAMVQLIEAEYILVTDAYDVLVNRWNEEEIVQLAEEAPCHLLVSCESSCYPPGPWCESYGKPLTPWWYPNGGQYVGRKAAILDLWREFLSGNWVSTQGGSTQEMMHLMHANGMKFGRDASCQIFQSMAGETSKWIVADDKTAWNSQTLTHPMLLHFNGRSPGIKEWYDTIYS